MPTSICCKFAAFAASILFAATGPALVPPTTSYSDDLRPATSAEATPDAGTDSYIVSFGEAPLALYASEAAKSNAHVMYKTDSSGRRRLDVKGVAAQEYLRQLAGGQREHMNAIKTALQLSEPPPVLSSMLHAANAVVIRMTESEAEKVRTVSGVAAVERDRPVPLATDIGPREIGAASLWWGGSADADSIFVGGFDRKGHFGAGMVIGIIDTGYNSLSPSFQALDARGYPIKNPLGSGNFLGHCSFGSGAGGVSLAGCNDKVIGAYDSAAIVAGASSGYSVEDGTGHGSHVASTAAGNFREARHENVATSISGVAPHANLVIYKACPDNSCPTAAILKSVDLAVADGAVDVLNVSISNAGVPWTDAVQKAFLSASDSGIFVAAAAGNAASSDLTSYPGDVNNMSPWVATVAAATHSRGDHRGGVELRITGPGSVPASLNRLYLSTVEGGRPLAARLSTDIRLSPSFGSDDGTSQDGCMPYAAGTFASSVAFINRGRCPIHTAVNHAVGAGALAVVVKDSRPHYPLFISLNDRPAVPVFSQTIDEAAPLQAFLASSSSMVRSVITKPLARNLDRADVLAKFSLRGPAPLTNVIKPDIQAPGVNILAAIHNDGSSNGPSRVDLLSGTSMATPHVAGAAALLKEARPSWSASEIKSALMLAADSVAPRNPDGKTASTAFARGSGSVRVAAALQVGLVLDESAARYLAADPGRGGEPSSLNLASMQNLSCNGRCSFARRFRSTVDRPVTWTASVLRGGGSALRISFPTPRFEVAANALADEPFTIEADLTQTAASDADTHFAEIVVTPDAPDLEPLRLPLAVARGQPIVSTIDAENLITFTAANVRSGSRTHLSVYNLGNTEVDISRETAADVHAISSNQAGDAANGRHPSFRYVEAANVYQNIYAADDFNMPSHITKIAKIRVVGVLETSDSGASLAGLATNIHWRIYRDAGGRPNGYPGSADAAIFTADLVPGSAGVEISDGNISLDLTAAGLDASLPAGRYWLVVYPSLPCGSSPGRPCSNAWYRTSAMGTDFFVSDEASSDWKNRRHGGLATVIEGRASCLAPSWGPQLSWLSDGVSVALPMRIPPVSRRTLEVRATMPDGPLPAETVVCLASADPATPVLPLTVRVVP